MRVIVNGEERALPSEMSLARLLETFGIDPRIVAIALNDEVVRRDTYEQVTVKDGDTIEVVRMVGGG